MKPDEPDDLPPSRSLDAPGDTLPAEPGRERRIAEFYEQWFAVALRAASRVVDSPQRAEDVVHDALCRLLARWDELVLSGRQAAYFMRSVRNGALDEVRREARERNAGAALQRQAEPHTYPLPEPTARMQVAERLVDGDFMEPIIRSFDPEVRRVWLLFTDMDLDHAAIAEVLGIDRGTVARYHRRGLAIVRQYMIDCGIELPPPATRLLKRGEEVATHE